MDKDGTAGIIVAMVRNRDGKLVDGITKPVKITSSFHGEVLAIRQACVLGRAMGIRQAG